MPNIVVTAHIVVVIDVDIESTRLFKSMLLGTTKVTNDLYTEMVMRLS